MKNQCPKMQNLYASLEPILFTLKNTDRETLRQENISCTTAFAQRLFGK